jgi:hypothetical protein
VRSTASRCLAKSYAALIMALPGGQRQQQQQTVHVRLVRHDTINELHGMHTEMSVWLRQQQHPHASS